MYVIPTRIIQNLAIIYSRTREAPAKVYPFKIAKIALKYAIIWAWNTLSWRGLDHVHPQKGNFKRQAMLTVGFFVGILEGYCT
jgi:hypothetical protein